MVNRRKFIKNSALTASAILSSSLSQSCGDAGVVSQFSVNKYAAVKPFLHGVASGDPLHDRVIIWTRITNENAGSNLIKWCLSKDDACKQIIQSGEVSADAGNDYTVKVDIQGLDPATTYYYQFIEGDNKSPVGKTKTTPAESDENIQLAVVSCTDYSAGYYNALAKVADRKDLNAVVHLGDYIYGGTLRLFDPTHPVYQDEFEATHFDRNREWWLRYYRRRYAINRLDADLQAAHQAHPFITIWDDHEIANNAWKNGAKDHDPQIDGLWEDRKSAARQAYAEWVPIRGDASKIYRSIRFGKMVELILLDSRLEGRDEQIYDAENQALFASYRTLLGQEQKQWLFQKLNASSCHWKVMANQVIFSEFNVNWANLGGPFSDKVKQLQNTLLDYWEGYPAERDEIINYIGNCKMNNVVILSASMHCALAFDVTARATRYSRKGESATYDPATGKGSVAVEFAASSISSDNFDERMGKLYAGTFQSLINKKLPQPLNYNPNPHLKFVDLQRHGYTILKLSKERAEADFYFVESISTRSDKETLAASWYTRTGRNRLENQLDKL